MRARTRTRRAKTRENRACVYETEVLALVQAAADRRSRAESASFQRSPFACFPPPSVTSRDRLDSPRSARRTLTIILDSTRLDSTRLDSLACVFIEGGVCSRQKSWTKPREAEKHRSLQRSRVYAFVYRATYGGSMWLVTSQRNAPIL